MPSGTRSATRSLGRGKRQRTTVDYIALDGGGGARTLEWEEEDEEERRKGRGKGKAAAKGRGAPGAAAAGPKKGSSSSSSSSGARASAPAAAAAPDTVWDSYFRRLGSQLSALRFSTSFLDAYEGDGWTKANLEKVRPEGEILAGELLAPRGGGCCPHSRPSLPLSLSLTAATHTLPPPHPQPTRASRPPR
jgi:hypothetical protein